MSETAPAVALLFDDVELGGQLREALHERGARIVHEGGVASLSRELLIEVGAEVVVVNLDDSADDALDQLYEAISGDRPRVVFNDAQASRALSGWDRARWARHLAVKVLAIGDVDPPRPENARSVSMPDAAMAPTGDAAIELAADAAVPEPSPPVAERPSPDDMDGEHEQLASAESENLAAELEALLASDDLPPDEEETGGPGLRFANGEDLPLLHDDNFYAVAAPDGVVTADARAVGAAIAPQEIHNDPTKFADAAEVKASATPPVFHLDHLELSPLTDESVATISTSAHESIPADPIAAGAHAPDGWALLDEGDLSTDPEQGNVAKANPADFGIEKLSAADFLAPDVEQVAADVEPIMSLQLVSMEEAIAPQSYQPVHEMQLDEIGSALSRLVLLGAAANALDSVCGFLAALPGASRLTFLHTQHFGELPIATVLEKLAAHSSLPVRLVGQSGRARHGEVLVVPPGQQVRLLRDGSVELHENAADAIRPSIDASFSTAANTFGRDALAIVFAGPGTDAVAGAQAIHDRGGKVWVESSPGEHSADMVSGLFAERLVSFSGTPSELAAHLIEVFP